MSSYSTMASDNVYNNIIVSYFFGIKIIILHYFLFKYKKFNKIEIKS